MTIALITFGIILAIVLVPYWTFVLREEDKEKGTLKKRLKVTVTRAGTRPDLLHTEPPLSSVPAVDKFLRNAAVVTAPMQRQITQSGQDLTVGSAVLGSMFLALAVCAAVFVLSGMLLPALVLGAGASFIPYMVLKFLATRRLHTFEEQFPEAIELMARALRAGHAFTTGLSMVAEEMPDPVGAEFRLIYDRQNFGMQIPDALRDLAKRVPLIDARFFVTAVLTQRESGGNLAEVLDNLAMLMRERVKVKRQVRTVSAHGRITGWVLAGMAPVLATVLVFLAPQHMSVLVTDPLGQAMVGAALVLQVIGVFVIRRIIDIEV